MNTGAGPVPIGPALPSASPMRRVPCGGPSAGVVLGPPPGAIRREVLVGAAPLIGADHQMSLVRRPSRSNSNTAVM
jgi:hypothetical protein